MRPLAVWGALASGVAVSAILVGWRERPPRPVADDAPATAFSADRAWPVVEFLADSIGLRLSGTPGVDRALAWLEARARAIPGVDVEIQDTIAWVESERGLTGVRVRNLIARRPGTRRDAVLVSVHYDSPSSSVGASDDAVGVAVALELLRALAAAPAPAPPPNSVIVLINGAEEQGLLGASAFLKHPLAADVRVVLDLESAGPGGKAILFQTGPGEPWLARAYARGAPHPYGSSFAQAIFQSGAIPSSTDFEVYVGHGWRGLDIAFYRDGWKYHTWLDRPEAISRGSVQHMGDNALGVVRALAADRLRRPPDASSAVYFDVLGAAMITYGDATAAALAIAGALLLVAAMIGTVRSGLARGRDLLITWALLAGGVVLSLVLTPAVAWAPWLVARASHGWHAHPARGFGGFVLLALVPLLLAHALAWRLRARWPGASCTGHVAAACAATLALLALVPLLGLFGAGDAAYVFTWTVLGGAAGLAAMVWWREQQGSWLLAALMVPGLVLGLQVASMLVEFAAIGGRSPGPFPFDVQIGLVSWLIVMLVVPLPLAFASGFGGAGRAAAIAAAAGLALIVWTAATFPWTPGRPQRLSILHRDDSLRVRAFDFPGPRRALAGLAPDAVLAAADSGRPRVPQRVVTWPAPPVERPVPEVVLESVPDSATRVVRLLPRGARTLELELPHAAIAGVPSSGLPLPEPDADRPLVLRLVAPPDTGWVLSLATRGDDPLDYTLTATYPGTTPAIDSLRRRLPPWTNAYGGVQRTIRGRLGR